MKALSLGLFVAVCCASAAAQDWPWWRGPERNGVADPDQHPPLSWSDSENILWKAAVPGRGHASPTVVGDRVYLPTSEDEKSIRSVIAFDRNTGDVVWTRNVHEGKPTPPKHAKGSQASSTIACDGERLFVNFLHDGGMYTSALSLDGEILWQRRVDDYVVHQGYGSSPAIFGPLVLVTADNKSGGAVAGLNRETGEVVWRHDRPETPNYASPIVLKVAGREQLILTGCDRISSFDPLTGEPLWEIDGATTECVTSTVTDGQRVYSSGGYPRNHVSAIEADGSGKVAWENDSRIYVPSMLVKDETLYATADAGFAICWNAADGEELWRGRLGGTFSSSPVLVGDRIYATNESGETFVFRADPEKFELLARSKLGDACIATPAICDGRIYTRVGRQEGDVRQEYLYCIGER